MTVTDLSCTPRGICEKECVQTTTFIQNAARDAGQADQKTHASPGYKYCYVLRRNGWRNIGMVADHQRSFYGRHFIQTRRADKSPVSSVAFVPFYWTGSPNIMTDREIEENAVQVIGSADI